jgi:hypothetical protein
MSCIDIGKAKECPKQRFIYVRQGPVPVVTIVQPDPTIGGTFNFKEGSSRETCRKRRRKHYAIIIALGSQPAALRTRVKPIVKLIQ